MSSTNKKNIITKTLSAIEEAKCDKYVKEFFEDKDYWHGERIRSCMSEASYYMLMGTRGPGKSTDTTAYFLKRAWEEQDFEFGYVRRWDVDTKDSVVTRYFGKALSEFVYNLTYHEYDCVVCFRQDLYFAKTVDRKIVRGKRIGSVFALNDASHYKSLHWDNINDYILEEFIEENGRYLPNEPKLLQELSSTIFRERAKIPGKTHIYLIGNTLSRNCPYFNEWGLTSVRKMKAGDINKIVTHGVDSKGNPYDIQIAVEMCVSEAQGSLMAIGQRSASINAYEVWTGERHPCLYWDKMKDEYDTLYDVEICDSDFSFIMKLLINNETSNLVLYVYPNTRNHEAASGRKITSEFSEDMMTTRRLNRKNKAESIMVDLLNDGKVYYSDNLTGDDFESVLKNKRGGI